MKGTMKTGGRLRGGAACLSAILLFALPGSAIEVSSGNSSININTNGSAAGMSSWLVDGVDNVEQQWFWYQPGSGGSQFSIDKLSLSPIVVQSLPNKLDLTYADSSYSAQVKYELIGGVAGSGHALLNQTVVFRNLTTASVTLFDYSDYDLAGTAGNQSIQLSRSFGSRVSLNQASGSFFLNNSFISGSIIPSRLEANSFGVVDSTLDRLQNQTGTVLNGNLAVASADVTGAVQWDLAAGATITISKVMELQIPEPSTAALIGLGLVTLMLRRNRREQPATEIGETNSH